MRRVVCDPPELITKPATVDRSTACSNRLLDRVDHVFSYGIAE